MKKISPDEVLATTACFRQRVNLPAAQVAGLAEAELAAALAFECEPFSGIPRSEGEMAWRRLGGEGDARAVFDVVQIRRADAEAEAARARRSGRRVRAVTAAPASGESVEDLPWIPVRQSRALAVRSGALMVLAALLVLALIAWDATTLVSRERALSRSVAAGRALQAQKDELQRRLASVQKECADLRLRRADEARAQQNADVLRSAWRLMLAAVPNACGDDSVLGGITAKGAYSARITGVALSADAAARTFARLAEALKPPKSGWRVTPGSIGAAASGGTVEFACDLEFDSEGQFR